MRLAEEPTESIVPWLENGDRLSAAEFLRRYDAMPNLKNAQLIEGLVHMPSPVRALHHAKPDGLIHGWLFNYALGRPDLAFFPNATLWLDHTTVLQPDAILCSAPSDGGRVSLTPDGYLAGRPELVVEVTATSASIDLHAKKLACERHGIAEYLVWLTTERSVQWFHLLDGSYVPLETSGEAFESRVFPGLVLDVAALLEHDAPRLIAKLRPMGRDWSP